MPGWWNWQTHRLEGAAPERACEFKSRSGHCTTEEAEISTAAFHELHFKRIRRTFTVLMNGRAHLRVHGLVQGVGFRYFIFERAKTLGITGYARNLFSGDVEIEVEGDRSLLEEFIKEVRVGPRAARVTGIEIQWLNYDGSFRDFTIR
jgi:acylphosphatase